MSRFTIALCVAAIALGTASVSAQVWSATASPAVANLGQPITITLESTVTLQMAGGSNCLINGIHQGSPSGPDLLLPGPCFMNLVWLSPGFPITTTWDQTDQSGAGGSPVPAGTYFLRFNAWDNQTLRIMYVPVRIDDPQMSVQQPILSATGDPARGVPFLLDVADPSEPFGTYVIAASFTTNQGLTFAPNQHLALDQDILFDFSVPTPFVGLWSGSIGSLDATGHASATAFTVPNVPFLVGLPIAFQAIVIGASGVDFGNAISRTIR